MNVLILDDVRLVRETLKQSLSSLDGRDFKIREASNGFDALDIIAGNPVDLVFVDIKMPRMDGLEFIRKARKINTELRFVILSSFSEFDYARSALLLGVSDYLLKPVSEEELETVLSRIGRESKSEEKARLETMEGRIQRFFNRPLKANLPENQFFFSFLPRAGHRADADYHSKLNSVIDDLSLHMSRLGIHTVIRSGDSQWLGLHFSGRENSGRIARELEERASLMEHSLFFILNPRDYDDFPCFSESRAVFFQNLSAMALICRSGDTQRDNRIFTSSFTRLRDLSDKLTAIGRGVYPPFREFSRVAGDIHRLLSNLSPDTATAFLREIQDYFSLPDNSGGGERAEDILSEIETVYMKNQFNWEAPFPENVMSYVRDNYMRPLGISEIARFLHKTPNALSSAFKKASGMTLSRYITSVRMDHAEKLLCSTGLTSKQIGELVGISDAGYFCKLFKEYTGLSPIDYRAKDHNSGG